MAHYLSLSVVNSSTFFSSPLSPAASVLMCSILYLSVSVGKADWPIRLEAGWPFVSWWLTVYRFSFPGTPEFCGARWDARSRLTLGQTWNVSRPGLRPSHSTLTDRNATRSRSSNLPQRPSIASPYGQSKSTPPPLPLHLYTTSSIFNQPLSFSQLCLLLLLRLTL